MTSSENRKRDPELTRNSILEAAERLFVAKGFSATSMTDIAKEAGVTKSLIHHHFESKDRLWVEIKKVRLAEWGKAQMEILGVPDDSGGDVMRHSIEGYFRFLQQNPEMVRLTAWMSLEDPKLSQMVNPTLIARSCERLTAAQKSGDVRADVDVRNVLAMLISLNQHWFVARNAFNQARIGTPGEEAADQSYLEDMMKIFLDGLAAQ